MITHDHILKISGSAITIMIGDHFADHHFGYIASKICISMRQFFKNLLKYMILPQFFWFPRKIFLIWKKLSVHIKKQQIFFREIRILWNYFSKLVIFQRSVIADHFTITHKIYDLCSLTIMISKNWKNMIYNHSWSWSDWKWSAITIQYA